MSMHLTLMGNASRGLPRNGLVALYDPYRDADGLDAAGRAALQTGVDYSGNGNTLTYGADTNASTDDPSNTGTAWSFDGGGDFLISPLVKSTTFTWLVAYKPAVDCQSSCSFVTSQSGFRGGSGFAFGAWVGKMVVAAYGSTPNSTAGAITFVKGAACVVGMRFGPNIDLMIGGVAAETAAVTNAATNGDWTMRIGAANHDAPLPYKGDIYFVAMWDRYLTNAEWMRAYLYVKSLEARRGVTLA